MVGAPSTGPGLWSRRRAPWVRPVASVAPARRRAPTTASARTR